MEQILEAMFLGGGGVIINDRILGKRPLKANFISSYLFQGKRNCNGLSKKINKENTIVSLRYYWLTKKPLSNKTNCIAQSPEAFFK